MQPQDGHGGRAGKASPAEPPPDAARPRTEPRLSTPVQAVALFGICGLAFAQPLFAVLAAGPTFFVTHDAGRGDILLLVAGVLIGPPLLLLLAIRGVAAVSGRAGRVAMASTFGLLLALTVVSAVDRGSALPLVGYAALLVLLAGVASWGHLRAAAVRSFATFLGPAPLLFAGVFLLASPVSTLVVMDDPDALAGVDPSAHHVVVAVFDELGLGTLLDRTGAIDAGRFPGFARLAATSTWYPDATTISPYTTGAVPGILSGSLPQGAFGQGWPPGELDVPPVAARHPHNLFTMLAGSHDLRVREWVTRLCPRRACVEPAPSTEPEAAPELDLAGDVSVLLQHLLLPTKVADERLPPLDGRWAGFATSAAPTPEPIAPPADDAAATAKQHRDLTRLAGQPLADGDVFERALDDLTPGERPLLWFTHDRRPHRPTTMLPDGRRFLGSVVPFWSERWQRSPTGRQKFLAQVKVVDGLVDDLLDRLEAAGMLDDTLLVVAGDHGYNFSSEGDDRATDTLDARSISDVMAVPLFVKLPGQRDARVDERDAQVTDVLPTIAAVLDVALPDGWDLDGHPLTGPPLDRRLFWHPVGFLDGDVEVEPRRLARELHGLFGPGGGPHDLFAMGPHRRLIGRQVEPLLAAPAPSGSLTSLNGDDFDDVALAADPFPALYRASIEGLEEGTWVVVALNGRLAGSAQAMRRGDGALVVEALLDPALFREGRNDAAAYLVDDAGRLRALPVDG